MTDTITNATADQRLAEFAERVRRVSAGEPDPETDAILAEAETDWEEPWRYCRQTERLEILLLAGTALAEDMQRAQYASLPQAVRDADAAACAAARAKRSAHWAAAA